MYETVAEWALFRSLCTVLLRYIGLLMSGSTHYSIIDFFNDFNIIRFNDFKRPFVKRFALCYRTVVCPVLSVTLMHCGQTVGWIKMPLGVKVGFGHIALDS